MPTIEAGAYMRTLVKNMRDAELTLARCSGNRRRACRPYRLLGRLRHPGSMDAKVRAMLTERGLIKGKRAVDICAVIQGALQPTPSFFFFLFRF